MGAVATYSPIQGHFVDSSRHYLPPASASVEDNAKLYEHVKTMVDSYTLRHPECLVLVTGDFNPTSTNIPPTLFKRSRGLTQIVNVLTRDSGILDWCLTNNPKALCAPSQLPKLGSSDHYCVLIKQGPRGKTTNQTITRRDTRASCIRAFGSWITTFSWDALFALDSCKDKFDFFIQTLSAAIDRYLQIKVSRMHSTDKPWLTPKIKAFIAKRQKLKPSHSSAKILHPSTCGVTRCRRR